MMVEPAPCLVLRVVLAIVTILSTGAEGEAAFGCAAHKISFAREARRLERLALIGRFLGGAGR